MTHYLSANISPMGDETPPRCYLSGADHEIPVIEFGNYPARFDITLGNHDDPIAYLRRFAAELSDFADVVEQAKAVSA